MLLLNVCVFFWIRFAFARTPTVHNDGFPNHFLFGVGSSAYQIEGAWNASGKGESIWDRAVHTTKFIKDGSTGDISCDSYHKFEEDIRMLKQLKVHCYRFSLSWTRLFPTGRVNMINQIGVDYYNNLINGLLASGISPLVTIFHWDTPQMLQDLGGWTNEEMIVWYREYADKVFELFGDRVKAWATFNEPATYCTSGYKMEHAPFLNNTGIGSYLCAHNIIKAHAEAYHLYRNKYKNKQNGKVGITLDAFWAIPLNSKSKSDQKAAEYGMESHFGWFAWPIFKTGEYPLSMRRSVEQRSKEQGFSHSRLPKFTILEKLMICNSSDYLGLNHYFTYEYSFANDSASVIPTKRNDGDFIKSTNPKWNTTAVPGFTITPDSLRQLILWVTDRIGHRWPIDITENGYNGDPTDDVDDSKRIHYLNGYVQAVLDAINQGANVRGYAWWSLMDSFEWGFGYTRKFGLYKVDFDDKNRTRTPRKSAMVYQNIIATKKVDRTFKPTQFVH